jgi:hypothetical protein
MLSLRFLLAALLMALVVGCQSKAKTGPSDDSKLTPLQKKIKNAQQAPKGPKLRP